MSLNCSVSNATRCGPLDQGTMPVALSPTDKIVAYSFIYGFISLVALVGNAVVCFVIIRNPGMRTVTNAFLLNLAISDIMFIVVTVPPVLSMQISPRYWLFGEVVCKAVPFLNTVALSASIYTMVVLAIDRYHAIVHPFRAKVQHTRQRTMALIAVIWVMSAVISVPQIPAQILIRYEQSTEVYCTEDFGKLGGRFGRITYSVAVFIIFFVIPITIITIAYTAIINRLNKTDERLAETFHRSRMESNGDRETDSALDKRRPTGISRNNRKITFMMLTVIVAFLICMLPINILLLVYPFLQLTNTEVISQVASILNVLSVCSSACNPIIYNFFSLKFRAAYSDVFRCKCKAQERDQRTEVSRTAVTRI